MKRVTLTVVLAAICFGCSASNAPRTADIASAGTSSATPSDALTGTIDLAAVLKQKEAEVQFLRRLIASGKTSISASPSVTCTGCCCASGSYGSCVNNKDECDNLGGTCVNSAPGC